MFEMELLTYNRYPKLTSKLTKNADTYYIKCVESLLNDIFFCILNPPFGIYFIGVMY